MGEVRRRAMNGVLWKLAAGCGMGVLGLGVASSCATQPPETPGPDAPLSDGSSHGGSGGHGGAAHGGHGGHGGSGGAGGEDAGDAGDAADAADAADAEDSSEVGPPGCFTLTDSGSCIFGPGAAEDGGCSDDGATFGHCPSSNLYGCCADNAGACPLVPGSGSDGGPTAICYYGDATTYGTYCETDTYMNQPCQWQSSAP